MECRELVIKKIPIIKYFMVFNYDENKIITLELPVLPLNEFKILIALRSHLNTPT